MPLLKSVKAGIFFFYPKHSIVKAAGANQTHKHLIINKIN
jgi:hypothetical protein